MSGYSSFSFSSTSGAGKTSQVRRNYTNLQFCEDAWFWFAKYFFLKKNSHLFLAEVQMLLTISFKIHLISLFMTSYL